MFFMTFSEHIILNKQKQKQKQMEDIYLKQ